MKTTSKVDLYKSLYKNNNDYNRNLLPMYNTINSCINFTIKSFLDYGCGKSNLTEIFKSKKNIITFKYDPAIEEFSQLDKSIKVDLIANCDVMEHIPEIEIDSVLLDLSKISDNVFFNIYLKEAKTFLPNGENAHCTIKPIHWWKDKIKKKFKYVTIIPTTYKNSVTIITWKISWFVFFKIIITNLNIILNYIFWIIRVKIFKRK